MNHTTNYNLNQWEAADKVRHQDFNADNAKIDAALKTQAEGLAAEVLARTQAVSAETAARTSSTAALTDQTKLHTIAKHVQSGSTTQIKLKFSGVDWTQWRRLYLVLNIDGTGSSRAGFNDMVDVFGFVNSGYRACLTMTPLYTPTLPVSGVLAGERIELVKSNYTFGALFNVEISCNSDGTIASGSTVTLMGEK